MFSPLFFYALVIGVMNMLLVKSGEITTLVEGDTPNPRLFVFILAVTAAQVFLLYDYANL